MCVLTAVNREYERLVSSRFTCNTDDKELRAERRHYCINRRTSKFGEMLTDKPHANHAELCEIGRGKSRNYMIQEKCLWLMEYFYLNVSDNDGWERHVKCI